MIRARLPSDCDTPSVLPWSRASASCEIADSSEGLLNPIPSASRPATAANSGTEPATGTRPSASAIAKMASGNELLLPDNLHHTSHQHTLHGGQHDANPREHVPDRRGREPEAPLAVESEGRLEARERRDHEEVHERAPSAGSAVSPHAG